MIKKYGPLIMVFIVFIYVAVHLIIAFYNGSLPLPWKEVFGD